MASGGLKWLELAEIGLFYKWPKVAYSVPKMALDYDTYLEDRNPKYPPPLKRGILWTWRVFLQKERIFPGAHKIGAAISGPRIAGKTF